VKRRAPAEQKLFRSLTSDLRRLTSGGVRGYANSTVSGALCLVLLPFAVAFAQAPVLTPSPTIPAPRFGKLPLYFEANQGQADKCVQFIARGPEQAICLGADGATLVLRDDTVSSNKARGDELRSGADALARVARVVRLSLSGGNPHRAGCGLEPFRGQVNYFLGSDAARWQKSVPTFARVCYAQVYPGVDLVYYGHDQQLEYDLVVAPGTDPAVIALRFDGADWLQIDERGDLVLHLGEREVRQHKPVVYQILGAVR